MHSFDPDDILEVAEHLLTRGGEGNARSAVSRAYYGVFLMARDLAEIDDESPDVHAQTLRHYVRLGEKRLADDLGDLRRSRNFADYKTKRRLSLEECGNALRASRRIRAALKVLEGRARYLAEVGV